ncbi:hypothetical protein ACK32R_04880 [Aeromonas dhakensis]|uniref:hypothetical protein n=1 Tax=Aeromonas dhakensis TaxID=196024 RepID=UPI0039864A39
MMIVVVAPRRNTQRSLQVHQLMLVDEWDDKKRGGEERLISCGLIYVTFSDGLIIISLPHRETIAFISGQMIGRCDLNDASNGNHRQIIVTQPKEGKSTYTSSHKKQDIQTNAETDFFPASDPSVQLLSCVIKAQPNHINLTKFVFIFIFHNSAKFIYFSYYRSLAILSPAINFASISISFNFSGVRTNLLNMPPCLAFISLTMQSTSGCMLL